ncbi:unnamed protein product [Amoebophrya sp. A25]|nr:unnamed protein product [Amoebophrya sp. A25]|eukprot:GSA25T00017056001.1
MKTALHCANTVEPHELVADPTNAKPPPPMNNINNCYNSLDPTAAEAEEPTRNEDKTTTPPPSYKTAITFGTFDLFHLGHLLILERAAAFGERLVVGVSSDDLTFRKKGKKPIFDEDARVQLVKSLKCVDEVFIEHSLEEKRQYCIDHGASVFIMGDDHLGRFDAMLKGVCDCHYLPRTKGVSSTDIEIILSERLSKGGVMDKAAKEMLEKSMYDSLISCTTPSAATVQPESAPTAEGNSLKELTEENLKSWSSGNKGTSKKLISTELFFNQNNDDVLEEHLTSTCDKNALLQHSTQVKDQKTSSNAIMSTPVLKHKIVDEEAEVYQNTMSPPSSCSTGNSSPLSSSTRHAPARTTVGTMTPSPTFMKQKPNMTTTSCGMLNPSSSTMKRTPSTATTVASLAASTKIKGSPPLLNGHVCSLPMGVDSSVAETMMGSSCKDDINASTTTPVLRARVGGGTSASSSSSSPKTKTSLLNHASCDASATNLTHGERTEGTNAVSKCIDSVMYFLVYLHDEYYLWIQYLCSPICKAMPREVNGITVFTANIVTYARTLLTLVICYLLKTTTTTRTTTSTVETPVGSTVLETVETVGLGSGYNMMSNLLAAFLVMFHDFLDHVDGVVAKVQREDGRAAGDCGRWGGFVDAQCDKIVFCTCLWTLIVLNDISGSEASGAPSLLGITLTGTCFGLIMMELAIAWVRTRDYYQAVYASTKAQGALRAIGEGKLKQKMESCGVAALCLIAPTPCAYPVTCWTAVVLLWVGIYFAYKSLEHKLRHSVA